MASFSKSEAAADQVYRLLHQAKDALLLAHGIRAHLPELLRRLSPFTEDELRELEQRAQLAGTALTVSAQLTLQAAEARKGSRILRNVALQREDESVVTPVIAVLTGNSAPARRLDWSDPLVVAAAGVIDGLNRRPKTDRSSVPVPKDESDRPRHSSGRRE